MRLSEMPRHHVMARQKASRQSEIESEDETEAAREAEDEGRSRAPESPAAGEEAPRHAAASARLIDALVASGIAEVDDFVPPATIDGLRARCAELDAEGVLRPARIGRGANERRAKDIRGDSIAWVDAPASDAEVTLFTRLETMRAELNRGLMAGLVDFEGHFARYSAGASYRRHLDRLSGSDVRVFSTVLYLNEEWTDDDGGQLRIHLPDGGTRDVLPRGGKLIVFRSEQFEHEVLPSRRERLSFTGWFRRRPLGGLT